MISKPRQLALRISLIYALVAGAWIFLSDRLVAALIPDLETVEHLQLYKGLAFVGVTAVLLGALLRRAMRRWEREAEERRQLEAKEHEQQVRLAGILNSAMDAIITVDDAQRIVLFNRAAEQIFGWRAEEMLGQPMERLLPERFRAAYAEAVRAFGATGETSRRTGMPDPLSCRRADGGEFPVEISLSKVTVEDRLYFTAIVRDNTKRQRAEEASRLFRTLVDHSNDAFEVIDPATGRFLDMSERGCADLGYRHEEILKLKVSDIDPTVGPAAWPQLVEKIQRAGSMTAEGIHRRKDGTTFPVEVNIRFISLDREYLVTVVRDTTERRRAEAALRQNTQRIQLLLDSIVEGIYGVDAQGNCIFINRAGVRMLGYDREEDLLGRHVHTLIHHTRPDGTPYPAEECRMYEAMRRSEGTHVDDEVFWRRDGVSFPVEYWSYPMLDAGRVVGAVASFFDITERRRAEAALREREEQLRLYAEHSPAAIAMFDRDMKYLVVSRHWMDVYHLGTQSIIGRSHYEVFPEIPQRWIEVHQRCLAGAVEHCDEDQFLRADGSTDWIRWEIRPWRQADGSIGGIIIFSEGITERKRAEEELRRATELLQLVLDNIPAFVFWKDRESRYLGCNKLIAESAGLEHPAAIVGKTDHDLPWRESAELYRADDRRVMESRTPKLDFEEPQARPDGSTHWLRTSKVPLLDADGNVFGVLGVYMDITDSKRAEAQLQLQSAALKAAANSIVITDAQGIILWVNDAFTRVTGYPAGEVVGKNPRVLKSGKHPPSFYEGLWKTILAGHVWHGEINNQRKDGTAYTEDMTVTPVRDAAGNITHFIAIKQDITEKLQLQLRLLRAQRLEGIGLLAGGIAHDLNNVLAPILMTTGLLRTEPISADGLELLDGLEASAQRGADIVRQVLTFARGVEGERVAVQVRHLIKDMGGIMRETFPKDIRLEQDVAKDLWLVKGDATQIHQVLLNLCINARDAMPAGGTLRLEARNQSVDEGFASMMHDARPGSYVVLTVADTGTGMAPNVIDHIFEPFFSTKERGKGTGLGLSTVSGIVRSHGGFIQVKSEVGRGSQFIVFLPTASKETFLAPDTTDTPALQRGDGEMILLVDDEKQIRDVAKGMLTQYGYRVLVAVDGMDGMVLFAKHGEDIALVLTDILMPFMDGAGMARAILRLNP
ncbi:MAG: PAS domain S-box protein, partial [Verrucomicrobia bacterium]|nr:PAS domain S-box protein [Verrucomicrobiota bacterium]